MMNTNLNIEYQKKINKILKLNNLLIEAKLREQRDKNHIKDLKEQIKNTIDKILNR